MLSSARQRLSRSSDDLIDIVFVSEAFPARFAEVYWESVEDLVLELVQRSDGLVARAPERFALWDRPNLSLTGAHSRLGLAPVEPPLRAVLRRHPALLGVLTVFRARSRLPVRGCLVACPRRGFPRVLEAR